MCLENQDKRKCPVLERGSLVTLKMVQHGESVMGYEETSVVYGGGGGCHRIWYKETGVHGGAITGKQCHTMELSNRGFEESRAAWRELMSCKLLISVP
jgi:hypothetical protein